MHELPSKALRGKKDSSLRVAIDLVKEGRAQACVSAGNTGALMATARFVLKTLPGIDRPAIISALPSLNGHTHVLDLGANAECSPEHLYQFAVMGSVLVSAIYGIEKPKVGLLNIGEEEIKGNDQIQGAAKLLSASSLNYVGFVEGDDIFLGDYDVVVCDGFVGNIALKAGEGLAKWIAQVMREEFSKNLLTKLSALAAMSVLRSFKDRVDPRHYNGASLLGLNGIVIKSHGSADDISFASAIRVALIEVEKGVPTRISHLTESLLKPSTASPAPEIQAGKATG
jgi:glycerol-3-phosphate acyltransferase PlsX